MTVKDQRSGVERREGWCAGLCPHIKELKESHKEDTERQEKQDDKDRGLHEKEHEVMWKSIGSKVPRWVLILIGGPIVAFTGWTALKTIGTSERVVRVEVAQEVMIENQALLMKHFDIQPVVMPAKQDKPIQPQPKGGSQ